MQNFALLFEFLGSAGLGTRRREQGRGLELDEKDGYKLKIQGLYAAGPGSGGKNRLRMNLMNLWLAARDLATGERSQSNQRGAQKAQ